MKAGGLKIWLLVGAWLLTSSAVGFAQQKIGWVDTQEIMKELPAAVEAQSKLDALVSQWEAEINKMQNQLQQESNDYQKRRLILPEQARVQEEQKLGDMQKKIVDLRNQRFGQNGDLYQQQKAIMQPVQEKIMQAIQDVAKEGNYDYIFDKSGQILMMYANEKYDVTQLVLDKLKVPTTTQPGTTLPGATQPAPAPPGIH
ncbi:MAG: OmpH family outer membrane protein [Bacteroidetes bacterium]|nr:OmpH family outer membrane protein [Bacteroidota bacterium]